MTDLTERLQRYCSIRTAKPLPQLGDSIHCVHTGTEHEAELRLSDLTAGVSLLETLTQENARLREALEGIVSGDVERVVAHVWRADGKPSKLDQCAHDVQINHDCPSCIEDHARKALGGGDDAN